MKIESITLHQIRIPLVSPFETAFGRSFAHDPIIAEVRADGLTGWGECPTDQNPGYSYETSETAMHILKDFLAPWLVGQTITEIADYHKIAERVKGHQQAKTAIELALWDLLGKRSGKSLGELWGGTRDRVAVGVSVGLQASPDALAERVGAYLEDGYGRIKIKIKPGRDVGDAEAVRRAFPDVQLQVDANSAYTLESAAVLQPLDDLNLLLIEQPLAEDDMWDHRQLQKSFRTPLCLDESIISPRHARQALEMAACRIVNIKPARVGGYANAITIHDLCAARDVPVWHGGMLETGIGRAANLALASLPNFTLPGDISATDRYYALDITEERFVLNADSTITVPARPGIGVTINRGALEKFTVAVQQIGGESPAR